MFFSSEDTPNNGPLISSRLFFFGGGGGLGRGRVRDFEGDHVVFTKGD